MGKIIAIIQNKGGVGKTSVTCNLAGALSLKHPDKKALIVDTDSQGSQATSFGLQPRSLENTIYDVLVNGLPVEKAIVPLSENLDLLPSNDDMNYYELDTLPGIKPKDMSEYFLALKKAIDPIKEQYDYIFIDSAPELKIIALNIMMAADEIYIPFEPDAYNAQGLIQLLEKIEIYKKEYHSSPKVKGVIPMKVRPNTLLHRGVSVQVEAYCQMKGIKVTDTQIPASIKYPQFIAAARMPITLADPKGKHSQYYHDLLKEVLGDG